MGMGFSGATVSGKIIAEPTERTVSFQTAYTAANAAIAFGAVAAGKRWKILSLDASISVASATVPVMQVRLNGVAILTLSPNGLAGTVENVSKNLKWDYSACPTLAAGQVLDSPSVGVALSRDISVTYVEETV